MLVIGGLHQLVEVLVVMDSGLLRRWSEGKKEQHPLEKKQQAASATATHIPKKEVFEQKK